MPLAGSGAIAGVAILAAIGNPDPKAIPTFGKMFNALASWSVANLNCLPGTMASAGAAVAGFGSFLALGDKNALGPLLANAVGDPSSNGVKTWTKFGLALIAHIEAFGQIIGSTFVAPTPGPGPLTGAAKISFTNMIVTPSIPGALGVSDPVAAASLTLYGTSILVQMMANAIVIPTAFAVPFIPFTSPVGGGPITGSGTLT